MATVLFSSAAPVTLIGGSPLGEGVLAAARAVAPRVVAADGGADQALSAGIVPEAVIGDMDSITDAARARVGAARLHPIAEQESTDFDKCLRSVAAPLIVAVGFDGARMDHALAAFNTLVRHPERPCVLLGPGDAVFLAPARPIALRLWPGARVSLFPLGPVRGTATGLRWPIDGIGFDPLGRVGTSNEAAAAEVRLAFDAARMLVIVPAAALAAAVSAVAPG